MYDSAGAAVKKLTMGPPASPAAQNGIIFVQWFATSNLRVGGLPGRRTSYDVILWSQHGMTRQQHAHDLLLSSKSRLQLDETASGGEQAHECLLAHAGHRPNDLMSRATSVENIESTVWVSR